MVVLGLPTWMLPAPSSHRMTSPCTVMAVRKNYLSVALVRRRVLLGHRASRLSGLLARLRAAWPGTPPFPPAWRMHQTMHPISGTFSSSSWRGKHGIARSHSAIMVWLALMCAVISQGSPSQCVSLWLVMKLKIKHAIQPQSKRTCTHICLALAQARA